MMRGIRGPVRERKGRGDEGAGREVAKPEYPPLSELWGQCEEKAAEVAKDDNGSMNARRS